MNVYWPVYLNLESEINKLMYAIHMDDNHLGVYSSIITDLILRASTEIETLSKELYKSNGGKQKKFLTYDYDCLEYLEQQWGLSKKRILISSYNCFFSQKVLYPFKMNTPKTGKDGKLTYLWNNSYQNLKHDRSNSLHFGNVQSLFEAVGALYVLNLYFKDTEFDIGTDGTGVSFDESQGSTIFSVYFHSGNAVEQDAPFTKKNDFEESLYLSVVIDATAELFRQGLRKKSESDLQYMFQKLTEYTDNGNPVDPEILKPLAEEWRFEAHKKTDSKIYMDIYNGQQQLKFKAVMNKNQY